MKTIGLLFLFTLSINVYAQNCEYSQNEKDDFTGSLKLETFDRLIKEFTGSNANLVFRRVDTTYFIRLVYAVQYSTAMVVGSEDVLMLKLSNDEVLNLKPLDVYSADRQNIGGVMVTQIKVNYFADKALIKKLSELDIKKVRFYYSAKEKTYADHEVKEKNAKGVKKAAECILKNP